MFSEKDEHMFVTLVYFCASKIVPNEDFVGIGALLEHYIFYPYVYFVIPHFRMATASNAGVGDAVPSVTKRVALYERVVPVMTGTSVDEDESQVS
jgi:hypothetical protein